MRIALPLWNSPYRPWQLAVIALAQITTIGMNAVGAYFDAESADPMRLGESVIDVAWLMASAAVVIGIAGCTAWFMLAKHVGERDWRALVTAAIIAGCAYYSAQNTWLTRSMIDVANAETEEIQTLNREREGTAITAARARIEAEVAAVASYRAEAENWQQVMDDEGVCGKRCRGPIWSGYQAKRDAADGLAIIAEERRIVAQKDLDELLREAGGVDKRSAGAMMAAGQSDDIRERKKWTWTVLFEALGLLALIFRDPHWKSAAPRAAAARAPLQIAGAPALAEAPSERSEIDGGIESNDERRPDFSTLRALDADALLALLIGDGPVPENIAGAAARIHGKASAAKRKARRPKPPPAPTTNAVGTA